MLNKLNIFSKKQEALILSFLATIPYSLWGVFINWDHGTAATIKVAITQCVLSFTVTLTMTRLLQGIYVRISSPKLKFPLTWLGTVCVINTFVFSAHTIVGTPERLATMAPGLLAGFIYSFSYTLRMHADKNFIAKN